MNYPGPSATLTMLGGVVYLVVGAILGIVGAVGANVSLWPALAVPNSLPVS